MSMLEHSIEQLTWAVDFIRPSGEASIAAVPTILSRRGAWMPHVVPEEAKYHATVAEAAAQALVRTGNRLDYNDVLELRTALVSLLAALQRIRTNEAEP